MLCYIVNISVYFFCFISTILKYFNHYIFDKIIESNGTLIEVQIGVNVIYRRSILPRNYN